MDRENGTGPPYSSVRQSTRSIQECIKDPAKTSELNDYIARARSEGMQTFDQHLLDLLRASKISRDSAVAAASNPTDFETKLEMEGDVPEDPLIEQKPDVPFEIEPDGRF